MAKSSEEQAVTSAQHAPRCLAIADAGIQTGKDFAQLMSALIADIAGNRIEPRKANAICSAGGKLLRIVELQHKYGGPKQDEKELVLAPPRKVLRDE